MQQQKSRLDRLEKITFGETANDRYRTCCSALLIAGIIAALANLSGSEVWWWFWGLFWVLLLPLGIAYFLGRDEFTIDFSVGNFIRQTGYAFSPIVDEGPLSDIAAIRLERQANSGLYHFTATVIFREELQRPSLPLSSQSSLPSSDEFRSRVPLFLELARRLNVPLYDSSGWQDWRPPLIEPKLFVIQPGEIHPVLLMERKPWE